MGSDRLKKQYIPELGKQRRARHHAKTKREWDVNT